MKTFNVKLAEYIKQRKKKKKEFSELIGHDIQSIIYFTSLTNPRTPTHIFLMKWLKYDADIDLNYFLKDHIETPQKLIKINPDSFVNEKGEVYEKENAELLHVIKSQNDKILAILQK